MARPLGLNTTLLVGIDPEERFFVSADPEMHNPTKFFIRMEFKDHHADTIKREGWHAWERVKRGRASADPVEVLVGGTADAFLDLVRFERAAQGLAQGDRQLLAEKFRQSTRTANAALESPEVEAAALHPLLREFQLGADEVLELISGARRLKMAVRGWVAEEHLRETLPNVPGITRCDRLDVEGGPDLQISYRDGPLLTVECKNVLRELNKTRQLPRIDFQRTRASKSDPCSRYYSPIDFDLVAGCLHAVTEAWEFRYALPSTLDAHPRCEGKLASNVLVDERWLLKPEEAFALASTHAREPGADWAETRQAYVTAWDALHDLPEPDDDFLVLKGKWAGLLLSIPAGQNYLWHTDRGGGEPLFGWRRRSTFRASLGNQ